MKIRNIFTTVLTITTACMILALPAQAATSSSNTRLTSPTKTSLIIIVCVAAGDVNGDG